MGRPCFFKSERIAKLELRVKPWTDWAPLIFKSELLQPLNAEGGT